MSTLSAKAVREVQNMKYWTVGDEIGLGEGTVSNS